MKRKISVTVAGGVLAVGGIIGAGAMEARARGWQPGCSSRTLQGTYGIQLQGTRPVPPFTGGTESVIGVVVRTYDGEGSFTQVDNVKGSVTGIVPDRPGGGTYEVFADCTVVAQLQPAPGVLLEERLVIVDRGNELRSIVASPLGVMVAAVHKRIDPPLAPAH